MSLLLGIAILALAIVLGGAAALRRDPKRAIPGAVRTFAVIAAASVALLHLLPEAIDAVGYWAIVATALGAIVPTLLERAIHPHHHDTGRDVPSTALAIGYAAVVAHQAGEGAALATLARTGALTAAIVLAIAAHTIPLAMIVAIRVLEARRDRSRSGRGAIGVALTGIVAATVAGALAGSLVDSTRLAAYGPWILALVAGLLLHALAHDAFAHAAESVRARVVDALAGLAGLVITLLGIEPGSWIARFSFTTRAIFVVVVGSAIVLRSFRARGHRHEH